jgi:hypothetical protein
MSFRIAKMGCGQKNCFSMAGMGCGHKGCFRMVGIFWVKELFQHGWNKSWSKS